MGQTKKFSSFSCELRIIQVQNVESIKSKQGNLFARFYLPTGNNNKRIQLNTKKIPSKSFPFWDNESFNLECLCPQEFLETLKHESLVLELRQSKKLLGSNLVGKGEVPWKEILESQNMELKKWVKMDNFVSRSCCRQSMSKAPEMLVKIKIQVINDESCYLNQIISVESDRINRKIKVNKRSLNHKWDECGCKHGHDHNAWLSADDYDVFALGFALEAF